MPAAEIYPVLASGMSGQGDNRDCSQGGGQQSDPAGGLEAVHFRHLQVHEHQIEGCFFTDHGQSGSAVGDGGNLHPKLFEQGGGKYLVDRLILGEKDLHPCEDRLINMLQGGLAMRFFEAFAGSGGLAEDADEPEDRSPPGELST